MRKADLRNEGFTLIEVLIALAIVSLGLMAVFMQMGQSLSVANALRDKTIANWIAVDQITELRLSGEFPGVDETGDQTDMAGQEWTYRVKISETPLATMRRVDVSVAFADTPDNIIASASGLVGQAAVSVASAGQNAPGGDTESTGSRPYISLIGRQFTEGEQQ